MILSESMIVFSRCAITSIVDPVNELRIVSWIRASVSTSIDAVASSNTRILDRRSRAREREMSCRCPTLKLAPSASTGAWSLDGKAATSGLRLARSSACQTLDPGYGLIGYGLMGL